MVMNLSFNLWVVITALLEAGDSEVPSFVVDKLLQLS
jgi:hypothetical protein